MVEHPNSTDVNHSATGLSIEGLAGLQFDGLVPEPGRYWPYQDWQDNKTIYITALWLAMCLSTGSKTDARALINDIAVEQGKDGLNQLSDPLIRAVEFFRTAADQCEQALHRLAVAGCAESLGAD